MSKEDLDSINIRAATQDDSLTVLRFFHDYLEEIKDIPEQELTFSDYNVSLFKVMLSESIRMHGIAPAIALIGNKKVGCNFWIKVPSFETKEERVLAIGTFVDPDFRKLGVCKKLCEFSFDYLKKAGVKKVFGKLFRERSSSEGFAETMGFEKLDILCKTL